MIAEIYLIKHTITNTITYIVLFENKESIDFINYKNLYKGIYNWSKLPTLLDAFINDIHYQVTKIDEFKYSTELDSFDIRTSVAINIILQYFIENAPEELL